MPVALAWKTRLSGMLQSHSLEFVDSRIVCSGLLETGRILWAFRTDGELAWCRPYRSGDHDGILAFQSRLYLDGRRALCLSANDGAVIANREFPLTLTQQPPSTLGPWFWVGESLDNLVGSVGLEPETLATAWEWPDGNCIVRRNWLRASLNEEIYRFAHLPDLAECLIPKSSLPVASGRQVMFSPAVGAWCAFANETATAITLPAGATLWRRQNGAEGCHRVIRSTATHAFAGTKDLSAYRLSDGELIWRQPLPGRLETWFSSTERVAFVVTDKRRVHRIDLASGEIIGNFDAADEVLGLAAVDDDHVVVGTLEAIMSVAFH